MSAQLRFIAKNDKPPFDPISAATSLTPVLAEYAAADDRDGGFAHRSIAVLRGADLVALTVPRSEGGHEGQLTTVSAVIGILAEGDPAASLVLAMQCLQHASIARSSYWPPRLAALVQRGAARDGTLLNALRVEPELGSPARGGLPATVARRVPEGWRISGRKIYSTGAPALGWGLVWARTDDEQPRVGHFLVTMETLGVRIEESWDQLGMRASGSHDVILDDVLVPADHAADIRTSDAWASQDAFALAWNTTLLASLYDGVARSAQRWLLRYLGERTPSNLGAPLSSLPRFQDAAGENERLLMVNRRLLRSAAMETDAGEPPSVAESGLIKLTVTENAIQVVQRAVELTGNPGLSRANPLERHLRDVLCARIHTPQSDTIRVGAGRVALDLSKGGQL